MWFCILMIPVLILNYVNFCNILIIMYVNSPNIVCSFKPLGLHFYRFKVFSFYSFQFKCASNVKSLFKNVFSSYFLKCIANIVCLFACLILLILCILWPPISLHDSQDCTVVYSYIFVFHNVFFIIILLMFYNVLFQQDNKSVKLTLLVGLSKGVKTQWMN